MLDKIRNWIGAPQIKPYASLISSQNLSIDCKNDDKEDSITLEEFPNESTKKI